MPESNADPETMAVLRNPLSMTVRQLQELSHGTSRRKGWYDKDGGKRNIPEMLMLMVSELSEALEEYRNLPECADLARIHYSKDRQGNDKPEGFGIELADLFIRGGDLCAFVGVDLDACIKLKMEYNEGRPYRHGNKTC